MIITIYTISSQQNVFILTAPHKSRKKEEIIFDLDFISERMSTETNLYG